MKCSLMLRLLFSGVWLIIFVIVSWSCKESLPVRVFPDKVISVQVASVDQLNDHLAPPGRQKVHIVVMGENIYDEVFWDTVNIKGSMRIWWKRKPERYRTLYLTEKNLTDRNLIANRRMLLLPGQTFSLETTWDMKNDWGLYLPSEMDFLNLQSRSCDYNVACGNSEEFVIELTLNIYDRLGYLTATAKQFTFYPRLCKCPGFPPCGQPGSGEGC
jgi:hypothetical protein